MSKNHAFSAYDKLIRNQSILLEALKPPSEVFYKVPVMHLLSKILIHLAVVMKIQVTATKQKISIKKNTM